ncbi:MAG: class I SAM-dependent methyltransferase, partial [Chloroflexi bacterium]|nr:class I SAM-dependent methyltransferase [Chloroflexota bacterium]
MRTVPETIDQDWERFYTEFPDIYDRFAVTSPVVATKIDKLFGVRDKIVVDVGSGTGRSTFALAEKARLVIGVDPWPAMRQFAVAKARQTRVRNVAFLEGVAQRLPLRDRSVDL